MYLLDTNVCIDFAKARSDRLRRRIRSQNGRGMAVSAITLSELRFGAKRPEADPEDERLLDAFIAVLAVRPFDEGAAEHYGFLGATVDVRRGSFDLLIAAHALALRLTLVTNNVRDFADIPGLRVENWSQ